VQDCHLPKLQLEQRPHRGRPTDFGRALRRNPGGAESRTQCRRRCRAAQWHRPVSFSAERFDWR
jgi:hypothetical protein